MTLFDQTPDLTKAFLYFETQLKPLTYMNPRLDQRSILDLVETCKGRPCLIRTTSLCQNTYTYYFFETCLIQEIKVHLELVFLILKHTLSPDTLKDIELPARIITSEFFRNSH